MKTTFIIRFLGLLTTAAFLAGLAAPATVDAKTTTKKKKHVSTSYLYNPKRHYKDEHVSISNPVSKCLTSGIRSAHVQALAKADKDGADEHVATTTPTLLGDAYRKYRDGLELAWGAMEAPYCGYGAFGVSAAAKSFNKSINRLHGDFVSAVAKLQGDGKADEPSRENLTAVAATLNELSAPAPSATTTVPVPETPAPNPETQIFHMANGLYYSPILGFTASTSDALLQALALQQALSSSTH